jgi:hypothetical protein
MTIGFDVRIEIYVRTITLDRTRTVPLDVSGKLTALPKGVKFSRDFEAGWLT